MTLGYQNGNEAGEFLIPYLALFCQSSLCVKIPLPSHPGFVTLLF